MLELYCIFFSLETRQNDLRLQKKTRGRFHACGRILSWIPAKNNSTPMGLERRRAKYRDECDPRATSSLVEIHRVPLGQRHLGKRVYTSVLSESLVY